jgi:hypothetical protein
VQVFVVVEFDEVGKQAKELGRVGRVGWQDGFERFDFRESVVGGFYGGFVGGAESAETGEVVVCKERFGATTVGALFVAV